MENKKITKQNENSFWITYCDQVQCFTLFTISDDMAFNFYLKWLNFTATAHFSQDHAYRGSSFLVYDNLKEDLRHNLSG